MSNIKLPDGAHKIYADDLRSCLFCKGNIAAVYHDTETGKYFVKCETCEATGPRRETAGKAALDWSYS